LGLWVLTRRRGGAEEERGVLLGLRRVAARFFGMLGWVEEGELRTKGLGEI
jgi:hypothetical protein